MRQQFQALTIRQEHQKLNLSRRDFLQKMFVAATLLNATPSAKAAFLDGVLFNPCGTQLPQHLTTHPIVKSAWQGIELSRFWDSHAHIAGTGDGNSGVYTSADMHSLWHPMQFAQHKFYLNAACTEKNKVDHSYVARMLHLLDEVNHTSLVSSKQTESVLASQAKLLLFAFDQAHAENGLPVPEKTAFHVPNNYAHEIAQRYPQYFEWVCSIHPYRPDAVATLEAAVANGARALKWLPSAMGIDPASPKCDAFYRTLAQFNMPLICHAGEEKAVDGMGYHDANNPLKMRRAMDAGVRVVIAHCASIGEDVDLDEGKHGPLVSSFKLFERLMANKQYQQHLYADISAITQRNRSVEVLRTIIEHQEWHGRLLNGSDYPLPGVLPLFSLNKLAKAGLLESNAVPVLEELQQYNSLLFDFVLKRQLRAGTQKLSDNIFHTRDFFQRSTL